MIDWFVYLIPLLLLPIVLLLVFVGCEGRISVVWRGPVVLLLTYNPTVFPRGRASSVYFHWTINRWEGHSPVLLSPTVLSDGSHEFRYEIHNPAVGMLEVYCDVYYLRISSGRTVETRAVPHPSCEFEYDGHAKEVVFRVDEDPRGSILRVSSCSVS